MKNLLLFGLLSVLGLSVAARVNAADALPPELIQLGHGFNLANSVEFTHEDGGGALSESDFKRIHDAGFTLVRVPIQWVKHAGPAPAYTVDPEFFKKIDWIVAQAKANQLQADVAYFHDEELLEDPAAHTDRFVAIWKQLAEHYKDAPPSVVFELMNEPHKKLNPAWNDLIAKALAVVRPTNPTRGVIVGPVKFNAIDELPALVLPESDHYLIVTIHYYDPMKFTHQGTHWVKNSESWLGTKWEGTPAERKSVADDFDTAKVWGAAHHRPIYLGEFGSTMKADADSRLRWTRCIAETAKADNFGWTYWEYHGGFGIYDTGAKQWRQPLLDAVLLK